MGKKKLIICPYTLDELRDLLLSRYRSFFQVKDIYKYSMEKAMYRAGDKNPFGCELLITGNGMKRVVMIYVADAPVNLDEVRFENSTDKDLIYQVVSKSVKKEKNDIRYRVVEDL